MILSPMWSPLPKATLILPHMSFIQFISPWWCPNAYFSLQGRLFRFLYPIHYLLPLFSLIFLLIHAICYVCLFYSFIIALFLLYLCHIMPMLFLCYTLCIFPYHYNAKLFLEYSSPKVPHFNFFEPYSKYVVTLSNFLEKSLKSYHYSTVSILPCVVFELI